MTKIKEIPLFIMECEKLMFSQRHPEYKHYERVYKNDNMLVGYLAYKEKP